MDNANVIKKKKMKSVAESKVKVQLLKSHPDGKANVGILDTAHLFPSSGEAHHSWKETFLCNSLIPGFLHWVFMYTLEHRAMN